MRYFIFQDCRAGSLQLMNSKIIQTKVDMINTLHSMHIHYRFRIQCSFICTKRWLNFRWSVSLTTWPAFLWLCNSGMHADEDTYHGSTCRSQLFNECVSQLMTVHISSILVTVPIFHFPMFSHLISPANEINSSMRALLASWIVRP